MVIGGIGYAIYSWNPLAKSDALDAVRNSVNDPDSVQFREVKPCPFGRKFFEGKFNYRGESGGYGDFKSFVASKDVVYDTNDLNKPFSNILFGQLVCYKGAAVAMEMTRQYLSAGQAVLPAPPPPPPPPSASAK